jgi:hypothetical protein
LKKKDRELVSIQRGALTAMSALLIFINEEEADFGYIRSVSLHVAYLMARSSVAQLVSYLAISLHTVRYFARISGV